MHSLTNIARQSDSLIELLTAQCADLEKLLVLARQETAAAENADFERIMEIVTERAEIGGRLEIFQRQIVELREFLGAQENPPAGRKIVSRIVETVNSTLAQDAETQKLLVDARTAAAEGLQNLEKSSRRSGAYLREEQKGLAYSRNF